LGEINPHNTAQLFFCWKWHSEKSFEGAAYVVDALISEVNAALAELQAEGYIEELVNKWYGNAD